MANNTSDAKKCTTCGDMFPDLTSCLAHEIRHLVVNAQNKSGKRSRKRRREKGLDDPETPEQKEIKNLVCSQLILCKEGEELSVLCSLFQPSPDNLNHVYERIHNDLRLELNKNGNWDINAFGSTITGLAFKCSDLDFYVENLCADNVNGLQEITKVLRRSRMFAKVIFIRNARVPIIKCVHKPTGYNLDINVSSKMGVYSSRFIGMVMTFDERIHPLMLIIKIWAKNWGLTKTGRMTNYCLIWLVFFYLQNCQPPLIHSVRDFQRDVPKELVFGINFAIDTTKELDSVNNQNIRGLLEGFFEFYMNFDFANCIISPFLGKVITRQELVQNLIHFPEYYVQLDQLKNNKNEKLNINLDLHSKPLDLSTMMVVQDPFILNQNKSVAVKSPVFKKLINKIAYGHRIFSDEHLKSLPSAMLLIKLFYDTPPLDLPSNTKTKSKQPRLSAVVNQKTHNCRFSPLESELIHVHKYLRKQFPKQCFTKIQVNKFWTEEIVKYSRKIIQHFFNIKMIPVKVNQSNLTPSNDEHRDVYSKKYSISSELKTDVDFWSGRNTDRKKGYDKFLAQQEEITRNYLLERTREGNYSTNLHCSFTLTPSNDFSTISISIVDLIDNNRESGLKKFFIQYSNQMRNFFIAFFNQLS